jgi:hypothetical protein
MIPLVLPAVVAAVDESYMLPVLGRFNGSPQVDSQGNIVYTFPDLQQTATVSPAAAVPGTGGHQLYLQGAVEGARRTPRNVHLGSLLPAGLTPVRAGAPSPLLLLLLLLVCRLPAGRRRCGG